MTTTLIAIVVFLFAYLLIISDKIHRTVIAWAGATLMIILGVLTQEQAIAGVDFNTLGLLIGMMVIVGITKKSGIFQYVAVLMVRWAHGKARNIFVLFMLITAVFSAFLDNVTTVMLILPMTFIVTNNLKIDPKPFFIGTILLSNIGGAATLIGDPPNILIAGHSGLTFNQFLSVMAPVSVVIGLITIFILCLIYSKTFKNQAQIDISRFNPRDSLNERHIIIKCLFVLGLVFLGFVTHSIVHLEGATIALGGAALLLLLTMNDPEPYLQEVEWATIFFFIGLFILVAGLEVTGVISFIAQNIVALTAGNLMMATMVIMWGSAIFSAIIDNIPFTATMIPIIGNMGAMAGVSLTPLWWALALGADIGGNATLIGASANVLVSDAVAREDKKIYFFEYLKVALPLTVVALIICSLYLWLRFF